MLGAIAGLDDLGGLEPVHLGHRDVEEDHGERVAEERLERERARRGLDEAKPERLERRLERGQVLVVVVDHQHGGGVALLLGPGPGHVARALARRDLVAAVVRALA